MDLGALDYKYYFMKKIIGLTGSYASGKDAAADYLVSLGFKKYVYSDYIREELKKIGKEPNRDNLIWMGNELRSQFGPGEISKRILNDIKKDRMKKAVAVGIRNPSEVEELKKSHILHLWFVDAPQELRYERSQKRKVLKDQVGFEQFQAQEEKENSENTTAQQLRKVAEMADKTLINDGRMEKLHQQIDELLNLPS